VVVDTWLGRDIKAIEAGAGPGDAAAVGLTIGAAYLDGLAAAGPRDAQTDDLMAALAEHNIHSRGDLDMAIEAAGLDVETLKAAIFAVDHAYVGQGWAEEVAAEYARLRDAASSET
jgi:hypothetical protein